MKEQRMWVDDGKRKTQAKRNKGKNFSNIFGVCLREKMFFFCFFLDLKDMCVLCVCSHLSNREMSMIIKRLPFAVVFPFHHLASDYRSCTIIYIAVHWDELCRLEMYIITSFGHFSSCVLNISFWLSPSAYAERRWEGEIQQIHTKIFSPHHHILLLFDFYFFFFFFLNFFLISLECWRSTRCLCGNFPFSFLLKNGITTWSRRPNQSIHLTD